MNVTVRLTVYSTEYYILSILKLKINRTTKNSIIVSTGNPNSSNYHNFSNKLITIGTNVN